MPTGSSSCPADAPLGAALTDLYGDVVLDVDVKPNRGDALSLVGLAREVAAVTGARGPLPGDGSARERGRRSATASRSRSAIPTSATAVRRSLGERASTIGPSPDRVQMRLRAAGVRPISNVVDASNYVMLELGKPIHTYDAAGVAEAGGRRR